MKARRIGGVHLWVLTRRTALALFAGAWVLSMAGGMVTGALGVTAATAPAPVMLDPGHGGVDGGTSHGDILEKQITLDVALHTAQRLRDSGVPVQLTRTEDVDLGGGFDRSRPGRHRRDLAERVRLVRACGAALLVSLHVNAGTASEEGMLFFHQQGNQAGRELATQLATALQPLHPRREGPIGRSNLYLLKNCAVPAVIVELGFITNSADRRRLTDPEHRRQIAAALATGIQSYYARWQADRQPLP